MSSSTNRLVGYPSIQHLASIVGKETTKSMLLNLPTKESLTWKDQEKLNFPDIRTFVRHVELALREVYDSVIRLQKHLMLVDKQNQKLKSKFTNYKKANKAYIINNVQLKVENNNLKNWLANLKKQLENSQSDKRPTPLSLPFLASPLPPASVSDDSDGKLKYFHYSHYSQKTNSTKLPDLLMLTDGHATGIDINMWKSKMTKKLVDNANYYPIEALCMAYVDSCMDSNAYKHLTARSKIGARKSFATAEEMFEVLQKAYGNSNCAHMAANKFYDLKMTENFNSFWAKFQVLVSELDHSKAIFIGKLKYKLTLSLFQAITDSISRSTDIHEYAKQCQQAYQDLKDIEQQTPTVNSAGNQYNQRTNMNTSTSTNVNTRTTSRQSDCPINSLYSHLPSVASNLTMAMRSARSKVTKLTKEEFAKL